MPSGRTMPGNIHMVMVNRAVGDKDLAELLATALMARMKAVQVRIVEITIEIQSRMRFLVLLLQPSSCSLHLSALETSVQKAWTSDIPSPTTSNGQGVGSEDGRYATAAELVWFHRKLPCLITPGNGELKWEKERVELSVLVMFCIFPRNYNKERKTTAERSMLCRQYMKGGAMGFWSAWNSIMAFLHVCKPFSFLPLGVL